MKKKLKKIGLIFMLVSLSFILSVCFLDVGGDDSSSGAAAGYKVEGKLNFSDSSDTILSSGNTIDFGTTTDPRSITFTITNTSDSTLNLIGGQLIAISGINADRFTVTIDPSSSIAPSGSTTFEITFTPDFVYTSKIAALTIETDDTDQANFSLNLTGVSQAT